MIRQTSVQTAGAPEEGGDDQQTPPLSTDAHHKKVTPKSNSLADKFKKWSNEGQHKRPPMSPEDTQQRKLLKQGDETDADTQDLT